MKNQIFYGNAIALNYALPADGSPLTVQLSPFGEFVLHDGGKMNGTVQHCTVEALQNVVKDWTDRGSKEIFGDPKKMQTVWHFRGSVPTKSNRTSNNFAHPAGTPKTATITFDIVKNSTH